AAAEAGEIFWRVGLSGVSEGEQGKRIEAEAERAQQSLDLGKGPVLRAVWLERGGERSRRLLLVIHHLVVDGVSWRILLEDLERGYRQLESGQALALGSKTSSFQQWAGRLAEYGRGAEVQ